MEDFPSGDVNVHLMSDPGATGNFEVFVDNALVHSKKTKGQGFVDTPEKVLLSYF